MKIKIKKLHPDAVIPTYAKHGDAGMDLTAIGTTEIDLEKGYEGFVEFKTGLSVEIPEGYVGLIFPRSSISKTAFLLANSVGVIDSGYRGEITVRFKMDSIAIYADIAESSEETVAEKVLYEKYDPKFYFVGDKIAQLMIIPYPHIEFEESTDLSETERGSGGYGSTDEERSFSIWSEGYAITGQNGYANYFGESVGKTFKEAVNNFSKLNKAFSDHYDSERMTHWGCKLFDNETDARKSFG